MPKLAFRGSPRMSPRMVPITSVGDAGSEGCQQLPDGFVYF